MASKFKFTLPLTPSFETISRTQRLIPLTNVIVEAMKTFNDPVSEIELLNQRNSRRLPVIKKAQNIYKVKLLKKKSRESVKQGNSRRFSVIKKAQNIYKGKQLKKKSRESMKQVVHTVGVQTESITILPKSTEVTIPPLLQNKVFFCNDRFKHVTDIERKALMKIPNWALMDIVLSNPTSTTSEKCKNRRNHSETEKVTKYQPTSLLKNHVTLSKTTLCANPNKNLTKTIHNKSTVEDDLPQGKATVLSNCLKSGVELNNVTKCEEVINMVNLSRGFPQRCSNDFTYAIHNDLLYNKPQTSEMEKNNPNHLEHTVTATLGAKCSYKGSESLLSQPKKWKCTFNNSSNKCSITSLNKSYKMTYSPSADLIWNKSSELLDKACKPRCFKKNYLQYRHIDSPMSTIYEMRNSSETSKKDSSVTKLRSSEYSQDTISDKASATICDRPTNYKTLDAQNTNNNNSSRHLIRQMSIDKTCRLSTNLSGLSIAPLKTLKHNNHPKTEKILSNVITKGIDSHSSFSSNTKQILEQIKRENEKTFYNSIRTRAHLWDTELQYQSPTMFPKCGKRRSLPVFRGIYEKKYSDNYYQARINCINKLNCTDGVNNEAYNFHLKSKPKRRHNPIL